VSNSVVIAPDSRTASFASTIGQGSFSDTFTFTLPHAAYSISAFFNTVSLPASSGLRFTSATLNGHAFAISSQTTNLGFTTLGVTTGIVGNVFSTGVNTLTFTGTAPLTGSLAGTLAVAAVPEPSQWAFMIAGLIGIAFVYQRQRRRSALA
jgi:hypothetical protein